jgi:DNA-binding transcriptional MocR family regulator
VIPRIVDVDATLDGGAEREGADGFGNVMSNASFSKIVGPGVRTGWVEGALKLAFALSQAGSNRSGGSASNLTGEFVGQLLASGALETHIKETLIPAYQQRWRAMCLAIETHLVPLGVSILYEKTRIGDLYDSEAEEYADLRHGRAEEIVAGGYFIYICLPDGVSADGLAQKAQSQQNLIIAPESMCRVPKKNTNEVESTP